jgi:hypothetical protein
MSCRCSTRIIVWLLTGLMSLAFAGCTTIEDIIRPETRVDYKKGYDFDHIEKIAIAPCGYSGFRPALLNEEQSERVNIALTRALEERGMQVVDSLDSADAVIDWHVVTEERSTVRSYNAQSYYQCWRCGPAISDRSVSTYTMGTFIVDIVDPELSKSVWRGVIKGRLTGVTESALQQDQVDAAAAEIFSRFPPGRFINGFY